MLGEDEGLINRHEHLSEKQIEKGYKLNVNKDISVFVFATIWPSWLVAARACGFQNIVTHVEDVSTYTKQLVTKNLRSGDKLLDKKEWFSLLNQKLHRLPKDQSVVILVQGPETTALKVKRWLNKNCDTTTRGQQVLMISGITDGEPNWTRFEGRSVDQTGKKRKRYLVDLATEKTCQLGHALVGGTIQHQWFFICNFVIEPHWQKAVTRQSAVRSTVQDILSHMEKGQEVDAPKEVQSVVPWKKRQVRVTSPSVFTKTKWVTRTLTMREMCDVYDVSFEFRGTREEGNNQVGTQLDFTQQIPTRVLLRCLEEILLPRMNKKGAEIQISSWEDKRSNLGESDLERSLINNVVPNTDQKEQTSYNALKGASKNDDAEVRVHEWNERVAHAIGLSYHKESHDKIMDTMRKGIFRRYCSHKYGVIGSFKRFMSQEYGENWLTKMREERRKKDGEKIEIVRSYDVGMDAIRRALGGTFWEWSEGSTILFWRWPKCLWKELRDGVRVWFRRKDLPRYWGHQRWPEDKRESEKLKEKIQTVVNRGYIKKGYVKSLTSFFAVPKGEGDIRVVYDATRSGLNDAIWSPNFFLPTMSSVLATADESTFFGDIDLGEMFLNYFLDPDLQPYAGVDVSKLTETINQKPPREVMRWERSLMGVRSSPFNCVRLYLLSEDIIKGDRMDERNPFRWTKVVFNLPGTTTYDPTKPWIFKFDEISKCMASFVTSYVDDLRTGSQRGKEDCNRVTHCTAAKLNYLGEQDAARKRRQATQQPGPWAGAVMEAIKGEGLFVSTTADKWKKTKKILESYCRKIEEKGGEDGEEVWVDRKKLEQDTGFLVHMFMAYENMRPYLKGFYLTLNGWRFDRDGSGWKLGKRHWEEVAAEIWEDERKWKEVKESLKKGENEPSSVRILPQMEKDVLFLKAMFAGDQPSKRLIRGSRIVRIVYGFGDASGAGFGASWVDGNQLTTEDREVEGSNVIKYRFGRWGKDGDGTSSNFRELCNLVEALEEMGRSQDLGGVEVFLFTDNTTAEAAFNRGSSSSPLLYGLIKRVKLLEMVFRARIHVIHVAGTRMIEQGTDGLSRGCLTEGVMQGKSILSFIPLHQTALERSATLEAWLQDTYGEGTGETGLTVLRPDDWFCKGQDIIGGARNIDGHWVPEYVTGQYIWAPPPCIAIRCMEELRRARHKRQTSTHVFICPRVMTVDWQKQLYRSADVILILNPGHPAWEKHQHEPLIIGLYFPYLQHEPWQLKNSPKIMGMAGHVQRVCKENPSASGCILRQLWQFTRKLSGMSEQLVRQMLQGSNYSEIPKTASRKRRRVGMEKENR